MTSSLVGSEMCIRDRQSTTLHPQERGGGDQLQKGQAVLPNILEVVWNRLLPDSTQPVSYTHLTLPTICSV
eukprot:11432894-Prorocentrum_lima.AAC.1